MSSTQIQAMKFMGSGCNGSSISAAINNALNAPSKKSLPAGATWPFVSLALRKNAVDFKMAQVQRSVKSTDVTAVVLSKLGYVFFRNRDHTQDFGFATMRVKKLIKELEKRGYRLDDSCTHNIAMAKISLFLMVALPLAVIVLVIVMSILKPYGV